MNKTRIGVIGLGFIGSKHAQIYSSSNACSLIAVCDTDEHLSEGTARELGCGAFSDYMDILTRDSVDAVSICLPEHMHVHAAVEAAEHGKHILLEKPLAMSIHDCETIIEAARKNNVKLLVGHLLRFDPKYAQAYQYVKSGAIGDIVLIRAQRNGMLSAGYRSGKYGSVVFHVGVHDIDLALWFASSKPVSVYAAKTERVLTEVKTEDSVTSIVKFEDDSIATIGSSWILPDSLGSGVNANLEILGSEGYVSIDVGSERGLRLFNSNQGWEYPDLWHWPTVWNKIGGCLKAEIDHFLDCLVTDLDPIVRPEDSLNAVSLALAMLESAKSGKTVHPKIV